MINIKNVVCETSINFSSDNFYIYIEIDDFTECLEKTIDNGFYQLNEDEILKLAYSLIYGVFELNKLKKIHGDIRPSCIYRVGDKFKLGYPFINNIYE